MKTVSVKAAARRFVLGPVAGAILFCMGISGCAVPRPPQRGAFHAWVIPPMGFVYTHFQAPLILPDDIEFSDGKSPARGREVYVGIPVPIATGPIGLDFALGRVAIESAARRAGIERLVYADYEFRSVLGYFKTMKIHAHGFGPAVPQPAGDAVSVGTP